MVRRGKRGSCRVLCLLKIEGSFNAYGSEGPFSLTMPTGTSILERGTIVRLVLPSGEPVDYRTHGLPPEYHVSETTEIKILSYAFLLSAQKRLAVPDCCFEYLWGRVVSLSAVSESVRPVADDKCRCEATIVVTIIFRCIPEDVRDWLTRPPRVVCFICASPCDDDGDKGYEARKMNCEGCAPCFLCGRCRFIVADGSPLCLDCMTPDDVRFIKKAYPRRMFRSMLVAPDLDWHGE